MLSPITNQRSDQYGGSLENRARLIVDIIRSIRQATSLGIMVRIPGQDLYPEGLSQADMSAVCRMFVAAGVSIIDVSSGIGGWNRPKDRRGEGYLVSESEYLKSQDLGVPVIGVGGIESSSFMELALEQERLDLIAVGRAILRGPIQFSVTNMINPENTSIA
ncbi:FMN oxidoreductase [Vibrio variabilis]|nr:FMN oxidoreductase [Vibrio variabilis]